MKQFLVILLILLTSTFTSEAQITLNDVTLPAKLSFNNETLVLNGAGVRTKYFFDLYTAGLYLTQKSTDAASIVKADETIAIRLEITSSMINSGNMSEAINDGFDSSTGGKTDAIRDRIDKLLQAFSSEEIEIGDLFEIVYIPGTGTQVYKNGGLTSTLEGMDFKQAVFGIWLSENPVTTSLKKGLLGK